MVFEIRELKLKKKNNDNKMKNCENELSQFSWLSHYSIFVIFEEPHILTIDTLT